MTNKLKDLLEKFEQTGRVFYHYPRKKVIRFNGWKTLNYKESESYLIDFFKG